MSVLNGRSTKASLVLVQSSTIKIRKLFRLYSADLFLKKTLFFYFNSRTEPFKSKLTVDRSNWLPTQLQILFLVSLLE